MLITVKTAENILPVYPVISKLWGYERTLVNDRVNNYCSKILTTLPNKQGCSIHFHKSKHETFTLLRGVLVLEIYQTVQHFEDINRAIEALELAPITYFLSHLNPNPIAIPPYTPHRFWSENEIAEFLETSTYDDPADSYRLKVAGPVPTKLPK